jgi:hypothetical protein
MFDTVLLRHVCNEPRLDSFRPTGGRFVFNPPRVNGLAQPQLTWNLAPNGVGYLSAMVSLPKLIYGNNVQMLTEADIPRALDKITVCASDVVGVEFEAWTANVGRLDVPHNWRVGETETHYYLTALRNNAVYPRLTTKRIIKDTTVDWSNSSEKVIAYSKHVETADLAKQGRATDADVRESVGILRVEHRFLNSSACRRLAKDWMKLPDRRAEHLLSASVAETVMQETIDKLGLSNPVESSDSRIELLREYYGLGSTFFRLRGFVETCDDLGEALVKQRLGDETFRRNRKAVQAAKAWVTNPSRRTLPPLRLVRANLETGVRPMASVANG